MSLSGYLAAAARSALATDLQTFFSGFKIHLFQNNIMPTPSNVLGDFIECNFPGYAPLTFNTNVALHDPGTDNYNVILDPGTSWQPNATMSLPQTAYGYYITDGATSPTTLAGMGTLTTSFTFSGPADGMHLDNVVFPIRPTTGN